MSTLLERVSAGALPRHVAFIMDGNGRWAEARGLPRTAGHQAGAVAAERLVRFVGARLPVPYLTLFAFSSENWARPQAEVAFLMDLLADFLRARLGEFVEAGVRLRVIGDLDRLPASLQELIENGAAATAAGDGLHLTIALSYGARQELVAAARRIASDVAGGRLLLSEVDEEAIANRLETAGIPDPDLVIRTSGEERLSNFLLWQAAYAELRFADVLWPDFTPAEYLRTLAAYQTRKRRFGTVGESGG
jgi:undecaprenyl diphosphate synthase